MKKRNIKIKRSKGRLYKRRRSPAARALKIAAFVIILGGLGFVGYSAAGPLIDYFNGDGSGTSEITQWTPDSSQPDEAGDGESTDAASAQSSETVLSSDSVSQGTGEYLLSEDALASSSALSNAVSQAKQAGFTTVIVPVKDESGYLLYSSQLDAVKDTELVTGTLYAAQIVTAIKAQGLAAKALVPTLLDCTTPTYIDDTGYRFADDSYGWLDAAESNGGKRWVDPFLSGTSQYYSDLAKELISAGFEEVLLSQLRFPDFTSYDQTILNSRNFTATRYTALTALYSSVNTASGNKAAAAVDIADVLAGYGESFGGTAEILSDKSFTGTVYVMLTLSDFGTTLSISDTKEINLSSDPAQKAQALFSKAAEYIGTNVTVIPVINPQGLTAEELVKCYDSLQ